MTRPSRAGVSRSCHHDLDPRANQPMASRTDGSGSCSTARSTTTSSCAGVVCLGHAFRTTSDSEVLIAALAEWGRCAVALRRHAALCARSAEAELLFSRPSASSRCSGRSAAIASRSHRKSALLAVPGVGRGASARRSLPRRRADRRGRGPMSPARAACRPARLRRSRSIARRRLAGRLLAAADRARCRAAFCRGRVARAVSRLDQAVPAQRRSARHRAVGGVDSSSSRCARGRRQGPRHHVQLRRRRLDVDETRFTTSRRLPRRRRRPASASSREIVADIDTLVASQAELFGSLSIYAQHRDGIGAPARHQGHTRRAGGG